MFGRISIWLVIKIVFSIGIEIVNESLFSFINRGAKSNKQIHMLIVFILFAYGLWSQMHYVK